MFVCRWKPLLADTSCRRTPPVRGHLLNGSSYIHTNTAFLISHKRTPLLSGHLIMVHCTNSSLFNSAESNTVTMYGRGFEKFRSAESHSVRCGFKFNNTYRQGMLYCKMIMTT